MSQGFWACCPCLSPSRDKSDTSDNSSTGSSEDIISRNRSGTPSEEKPLTFPKHGLQWRLGEILQQHCESKQQLRGLLVFVHKILESYDSVRTPAGTGLQSDANWLWTVLGALPQDPQFRDRCRELVQVLEKGGISMSLLNAASTDTHLLRAIKSGNRAALDALLHTKCDINATDRYSSTCLIYAVKWNDADTVRTILARFRMSLNLDKADYANYTALAYAASNNCLGLCRLLLDAGARPDVNSTSPLFLAVDRGASLELIELLISRGASVNVSSADGLNAVAAAVRTRKAETVSLLLRSGANEPAAWHKSKAFLLALGTDHLDILRILVRHGTDIAGANPKGSTVAHEACARGSPRFLRHVIDTTEVDLDARNRLRCSAAHCAAYQGDDGCLKALFLAGADCWSLDAQGLSTLQIVLFSNRAHCVSFFLDHPVFPRQALFSTLHLLRNRYDPEALSRKPAVAEFASLLQRKWGEGDQVDTLLTTSVIAIRRLLGQKAAAKVKMLPLPEKMKRRILNYQ